MKKYGILFAFFLTLAACASDSDKKNTPTEPAKPEIKTDNLICPQVAILQEAQEVMDYGGEKANPAQLVAKARLKSVEGDCAYRTKDNKSGIDIKFTLHEVAERGSRLGGDQVTFPYFIAIADPDDNVIDRQVMTAQITFKGDDKVTEQDEHLHVFIPLKPDVLLAGPSYRVLIGFKKVAH